MPDLFSSPLSVWIKKNLPRFSHERTSAEGSEKAASKAGRTDAMSCADSSSASDHGCATESGSSSGSSSTGPAQPAAASSPASSGDDPSLTSPETPSPPRRHSHHHHHHHHHRHTKTKRTITARPAADTPAGQAKAETAAAAVPVAAGLSPEALAAAAARPGSIMHESARQSYTLASVKVGMSESMLRDLARKGKTETVAFHRGSTAGRVIQYVPYPETAHLTENMLFDPTTDLPSLTLLRTHLAKEGEQAETGNKSKQKKQSKKQSKANNEQEGSRSEQRESYSHALPM